MSARSWVGTTPKTVQEALALKRAQTDVAVVEKLATTQTQCSCLAAWDDDRECICGPKKIEVPLDVAAVKKAGQLIDGIAQIDERIAAIEGSERDSLDASVFLEGRANHMHNMMNHRYPLGEVAFQLPRKLLLAVLQAQRHDLTMQLSALGLVSVSSHNVRSLTQ